MWYYFIDSEIYFQGKQQPPRKVEIFSIYDISNDKICCRDADGDVYELNKNEIIMEKD